jgi:hypothetical protein
MATYLGYIPDLQTYYQKLSLKKITEFLHFKINAK